MRKFMALLLTCVLVLTLVPAAFAENAAEREYVELDWWFYNNDQPAAAEVDEYISNYILEKLNTKVNIHRLSDYADVMPTKISAGDDLGIVGIGTHINYATEAARGAFADIGTILPEYAPQTYALFSEDVWEGMKIGGVLYGVPTWKDNCYIMGMIYNNDMATELGIDPFSVDFKVWTDLIPLFYEAKEKRDAAHPEYADYPLVSQRWGIFPYDFVLECFNGEMLCTNIPGAIEQGADSYQPNEVFCLYQTEEFREYALLMNQLTTDNIYAYEYPADTWSSEKLFAWTGWGYVTLPENVISPEVDAQLRIPDVYWIDTSNLTGAGNAISAHCKTPERAMEVLELINTDTTVATSLRFGIEGTHWVRDDAGLPTFAGTINEKKDLYYNWYGGQYGSLSAVEVPASEGGASFIDLIKQYNDTAIVAENLGFVFDTANVVNEIAAVSNVESQYKTNIRNGLYDDAEMTEMMLDEFLAKLTANGIETLKTECQAQLDAWRAAKGK